MIRRVPCPSPINHQTENEVEDQIVTFLRREGWIVRRQHSGLYYTADGRPVRIGEVGECDWRAMRAKAGGYVEYMEIEVKATKKRPGKAQRQYIAKRRHQGFFACWTDSLSMLQDYMREVGLLW
jgi:hypothetical protein